MHTLRFFAFNLLGHVLPMVVALVSVPVIAHAAGVERLGALGIVWALVGYFSFLDFGLSRVVTRRVANAADQGNLAEELTILRGFFWWRALPGLLAIGAVLWLLRPLFQPYLPPDNLGREITAGWVWIAWSIPVTLATNWLRGALEGVHRFARVNLLRTVFGAWTYAAPAVAALVSPTLDSLIAAIVIGRVLALLAHALASLRAEPGILLGAARPSSMRIFFQEGGWITVSNIIGPLMVYSDRFVLAALLPPKAVAWYVTSQEVMLRTLVIPAALTGVLFPKFAGKLDARSEAALTGLYERGIRVAAALMLPLCALAAAGAYDGLRLWLGEDFAINGYRVVEIVAVGIFVNAIATLPFAWLQATGRSNLTARIHLIELPLYAAGLYVAAVTNGIVGAAALWTVRVTVDCLLLLSCAGRTGLRPAVPSLLAGMTLVIAAGLCSHPMLPWPWRAVVCMVAILTGLGLGWMQFLSPQDRNEVLRRPRHRVDNQISP
ncbi:flippase [Noviherbaspirillum sp. Root189]|uniref:flippase n=1 Tax=Noviherbaspirillum sp. Root189 TaxID=1736487 RepID=UPI00070A2AD3|nr:flippase [Noviherbaspirillum sp. Root189]KRB90542.1 hypothetical protein ASE07_17295 [Noviherbaspirillum sp. Root189]